VPDSRDQGGTELTHPTGLLDRFLAHGETTTSLINATPIARRDPPLDDD
jgi:hypothetical protein